MKKIQTQDLRSVVVSNEAAKEFDDWKNEFMKNMSWSGSCTSWYKNGTADGKVIGKLHIGILLGISVTDRRRTMARFSESFHRNYESS